jgi:hypothetical protein
MNNKKLYNPPKVRINSLEAHDDVLCTSTELQDVEWKMYFGEYFV